ncbi:hypothetical protein Anapl_17961 [Anas platyrhynchos]|uniref:Uncharacterized protein n=1 Tax=Anas platyrhynchos TaxID=8839 RepID=R0L378_ANAPL|nr:hypothetical protein Anapl_17961 [Anas platyrhynchos]
MKLHAVKGYRIKINLDAERQSKSQQTSISLETPRTSQYNSHENSPISSKSKTDFTWLAFRPLFISLRADKNPSFLKDMTEDILPKITPCSAFATDGKTSLSVSLHKRKTSLSVSLHEKD